MKHSNPRRFAAVSLAVLILALAQLACGSPVEMPTATVASAGATVAVEPTETVEPTEIPTPEAQGASRATGTPEPADAQPFSGRGVACVASGVSNTGITCTGEDGWQNFGPEAFGYVSALAGCADGRILVVHADGISAFDGVDLETVTTDLPDEAGVINGVACSGSDDIWLAHFRGISHYDGSAWTVYPASDVATGEDATDVVSDVAVASDGAVWVLTLTSVARWEGDGRWTVYNRQDLGLGEFASLRGLVVDEGGRPWVLHPGGFLVFDGGEWVSFEAQYALDSASDVVFVDNRLWIGADGGGIIALSEEGSEVYDRDDSGLGSNSVRRMSVDAQGRVWTATGWGLYVFDGGDWHAYRMENAALPDNDFTLVALTGAPALPASVEKESGSLGGRIVAADEQPLAGSTVEVCVEPIRASGFYGMTPCSLQPFQRSTTTDADGAFSFENLPAGYYIVMVGTEDGWIQMADRYGTPARVLVEPGRETDVLQLTLGD